MKTKESTSTVKFKTTSSPIEKPWPHHIPKHCPNCGCSMSRRVNLFIDLSQQAHSLKRIAPWLSIVVLAIAILIMVVASGRSLHGLGQGSPMALVAMIIAPPVLLTIIANCMKKVHKLQCHQCGNQQEFELKND